MRLCAKCELNLHDTTLKRKLEDARKKGRPQRLNMILNLR